jgi:hypothetical protein
MFFAKIKKMLIGPARRAVKPKGKVKTIRVESYKIKMPTKWVLPKQQGWPAGKKTTRRRKR